MLLDMLIHATELLKTPGKKHNCALNHWKVYWNASVNSGVHISLLSAEYQASTVGVSCARQRCGAGRKFRMHEPGVRRAVNTRKAPHP